MPPRFSSRMLALVLAALVFGCTIENAAARPDPERVRPAPKPTLGQRAARIAVKAVGIPYRWGGSSPSTGFDCSGLVSWAYGRLGVELPHSSYALYDTGRRVSLARLKPGDLLFFSGLGHVGLYVGRGRMVHAPQSGRLVEVVTLSSGYGSRLVGARRIVRG
jgi:cell wall-associated NlpC family hydrolase